LHLKKLAAFAQKGIAPLQFPSEEAGAAAYFAGSARPSDRKVSE